MSPKPTTPNSPYSKCPRCYTCFRPIEECFCDSIPSIENRTEVLILQHVKERAHPFNTARIVHKALQNSTLLVDHTDGFSSQELPLKPGAGVLYPGPGAREISDLSPEERPRQLVILDGTWHQVRTMMRDMPVLNELPRYQLLPAEPGRYRIRREPTKTSLSTLEATVAALKVLEPETTGLDQLYDAFDQMIERQLVHHNAPTGVQRTRHRKRTELNIPRTLTGDLANIVVAYGESTPGKRGQKHASRYPVYWVAERLVSGERFASTIRPPAPFDAIFDDTFLAHLELTPADFASAASPATFCASWSAFLRPSDLLVVYHPTTAQLLRTIGAEVPPYVLLKSIDFEEEQHYHSLEEILTAKGLVSKEINHPGRAGKRLMDAITLARYLSGLRKI